MGCKLFSSIQYTSNLSYKMKVFILLRSTNTPNRTILYAMLELMHFMLFSPSITNKQTNKAWLHKFHFPPKSQSPPQKNPIEKCYFPQVHKVSRNFTSLPALGVSVPTSCHSSMNSFRSMSTKFVKVMKTILCKTKPWLLKSYQKKVTLCLGKISRDFHSQLKETEIRPFLWNPLWLRWMWAIMNLYLISPSRQRWFNRLWHSNCRNFEIKHLSLTHFNLASGWIPGLLALVNDLQL